MPKKRTVSLRSQTSKILKEEKYIKRTEKKILKEQKALEKQEKNLEKIEKNILKEERGIRAVLKSLKIEKHHVLDFIRIAAGALVGTGLGSIIIRQKDLALTLPWRNILGIIFVALLLAGLLVYKAERKSLEKRAYPLRYIAVRVAYIWIIATVISGATSLLFIAQPELNLITLKSILIGSFPAIAGAIGFNFI